EPEVLDQAVAAGCTPLDDMVRNEARAEVWKGLEKLKAVDRATLVAFYIRGRSLKQMSREFETPIGTIKRRLHVARNRLRRTPEQSAGPAAGGGAGSGGAGKAHRPHRRRKLACV